MFERTITFDPAFDKRHDDPAQEYGIGSVTLSLVLRGERGAVALRVFTGWDLPEVQRELDEQLGSNHTLCHALPESLSWHSLRPREGWNTSASCDWLDKQPCHFSTGYMAAEPVWKRLLYSGDAGVWAALEESYGEYFEEHNDVH